MKVETIDSGILKRLYSPPEHSHKGQNGILTVIGGSKKYHGAPLLAIKAASRFVDLLYFHSPGKNNLQLLQFLKSRKSTFIAIERKELEKTIAASDCVLIGNGLEINGTNRKLIDSLIKKFPRKKFVLDAGALHMVNKKLLGSNICVTPHVLEFSALFGKPANQKNVFEMALKHKCVILLKHPESDYVSDGEEVFKNETGNEGMTKGGTGDTLAGLVAALACKNELFLAAVAGIYLNGLAGDMLKKERGIHFDADDLADYIPLAFQKAIN